MHLKKCNWTDTEWLDWPEGRVRARDGWARAAGLRQLRAPGAAGGAGGRSARPEGIVVEDVVEVPERQLVIVIIVVHIKIVHVDTETKIIISTLACLVVVECSLNGGLKGLTLFSDKSVGTKLQI